MLFVTFSVVKFVVFTVVDYSNVRV